MDKQKHYRERMAPSDQYDLEIIPEEFPEGPFGSPINKDKKVSGKSTPWKQGQRRASAYVYPDKDQHDDLPRQYPDAHPLHDK